MNYVKKNIAVPVRFARVAEVVVTLEGDVKCLPGDAILTGPQGEHWPVARQRFEQSYEPVPPTQAGSDGNYRKRFQVVQAEKVQEETRITLNNHQGTLTAQAGDWLLSDESGQKWVVQSGIFEQTYTPHDAEPSQQTSATEESGPAILSIPVYITAAGKLNDNDETGSVIQTLRSLLPHTPLITDYLEKSPVPIWFKLGAPTTPQESTPGVEEKGYDAFVKATKNALHPPGVWRYTFHKLADSVLGLIRREKTINELTYSMQMLAEQLAAIEAFNRELQEYQATSSDLKNYLEAYTDAQEPALEGLRTVGALADKSASAYQTRWQRLVFTHMKAIAQTSQGEKSSQDTGLGWLSGLIGRLLKFARLFCSPSLVSLGLIAAIGLAAYSEMSGGCGSHSGLAFCDSEIWKQWFGGFSIALYSIALCIAWVRYAQAKTQNWENKHQDYRLLAECLRVQYVYCVLHTSIAPETAAYRNVSDEFPDTLSTESSWVRLAMASLMYALPWKMGRQDSIRQGLDWVNVHFITHQSTYHGVKLIGQRKQAIHILSLAGRWGCILFLSTLALLVSNEIGSVLIYGTSGQGFLNAMWCHLILIMQVFGLAFWGGMRKVLDNFALEQEAQRGDLVLKSLQAASGADLEKEKDRKIISKAINVFLKNQMSWHSLHRNKPIEAITGG